MRAKVRIGGMGAGVTRKKRGGSPSHTVREPPQTLSDGTSASLNQGHGGRCTDKTGNLAPLISVYEISVPWRQAKNRSLLRSRSFVFGTTNAVECAPVLSQVLPHDARRTSCSGAT